MAAAAAAVTEAAAAAAAPAEAPSDGAFDERMDLLETRAVENTRAGAEMRDKHSAWQAVMEGEEGPVRVSVPVAGLERRGMAQ